jgi:serine/threonine protein kinase
VILAQGAHAPRFGIYFFVGTMVMAEAIPGYRLLQHLGSGYFGDVWKAEGPDGKPCAIKLVAFDWTPRKSTNVEGDFKNLVKVSKIRDPHLLMLERLELVDEQLLVVMELAEKNLFGRFRECKKQGLPGIPPSELRQHLLEAAEIIDLMNGQHQIPHWNLKPQNLLLVGGKIKVSDFGQVVDLQTHKSGFKGGSNPIYSAPEIFDGSPGASSDQYSIAIIYQEMLTGERPFFANTLYQLMTQHLHAQPRSAGDSPGLVEETGPSLRQLPGFCPRIVAP